MSSSPTALSSNLRRVLGRWDLTAIGINQLIGSGIFLLPATVALLVGSGASPLVFVVAAAVNTLIVLCFAEASSRFRAAGGPYLYTHEALGPFAGFEVAWMLWLTRVASQASLANAFVLYLAYFWPQAPMEPYRSILLATLIGLLAVINLAGVRYGSWTINFLTVGKLLPLCAFVGCGLFFVDWSRFASLLKPNWSGFGEGILVLMFAFGGYELITLPAGEAKSPRRDVPASLLATILSVSVFFLLIQIVAVGTLPALEKSATPLAEAASSFLGASGGILLAIGALISISGANAGTMLAGPRVTYALAQRKQLPSIFAHVQSRWRTPDFSILVYALFALVLALKGSFVELAKMSAIARLIFYTATCASVIVSRKKVPSGIGFQLPGGNIIPGLALLASLAIIFGANWEALGLSTITLLLGALIWLVQRRVTVNR